MKRRNFLLGLLAAPFVAKPLAVAVKSTYEADLALFQQRVLAEPIVDVMYMGARGGGKSVLASGRVGFIEGWSVMESKPNVLTNLIPGFYQSLDVVSRDMCGTLSKQLTKES